MIRIVIRAVMIIGLCLCLGTVPALAFCPSGTSALERVPGDIVCTENKGITLINVLGFENVPVQTTNYYREKDGALLETYYSVTFHTHNPLPGKLEPAQVQKWEKPILSFIQKQGELPLSEWIEWKHSISYDTDNNGTPTKTETYSVGLLQQNKKGDTVLTHATQMSIYKEGNLIARLFSPNAILKRYADTTETIHLDMPFEFKLYGTNKDFLYNGRFYNEAYNFQEPLESVLKRKDTAMENMKLVLDQYKRFHLEKKEGFVWVRI